MIMKRPEDFLMSCLNNKMLLMLVILMLPCCAVGQGVAWEESYGGIYNENGSSGMQASDGGYLIVGSTYSFGAGSYDIYVLKTDVNGDTLWTSTYGGPDTDHGYGIDNSSDGDFIIVGSTRSFGSGQKDVYLVKIDSSGAVQWSKSFGGAGNDEGWSVMQTDDKGYIICGNTDSYGAGYSDLYLVKTDSLGDTLWTKTFGGSGGESGYSVRQCGDGGYVAVGSTGSFGLGYSSVYVVRVDSSGDSLWATDYGGDKADVGYSIEIAYDGGFLITGATASFGAGYTDAYLIKTDSQGNVEWEKTYGGPKDDRAYSICLSMDGGYLLAGSTDSYGAGKPNVYLIKTTPLGDTVWTRAYGGAKSDIGKAVFQEMGKNYIVVGESYSYSPSGSDVYIMKIKGETTPVPEDGNDLLPEGFRLAQNYPNPFNATTTIEFTVPRRASVNISIYNLLGQLIYQWQFDSMVAGRHAVQWNGRDNLGYDVASGIYLCRFMANDYSDSKKMVLLK